MNLTYIVKLRLHMITKPKEVLNLESTLKIALK